MQNSSQAKMPAYTYKERRLNQMTGDFLPCPFCGNAETDEHNLDCIALQEQLQTTLGYGLPAPEPYNKLYYVRCGKCSARAGVAMSGYNALLKETITEEEAKQIAIRKWNERA